MIYKFVELPSIQDSGAGGNYLKKLHELDLLGVLPRYCHVDAYHDAWCESFKGKPCNCDPEVKWQEIKAL